LEGNPTTLAPDSQNGSVPQSQYRNKLIYVIDDQGQQGLAGAIMIDNDIPICDRNGTGPCHAATANAVVSETAPQVLC